MNLKIVKWLLAHQSALLQVVEIAKGYDKTKPWVVQWDVVDKIARIVLPIMESELATPKTLAVDEPVADREVQILALQTQYAALGIDWKLVVEVIIPLIVALLRAISGTEE